MEKVSVITVVYNGIDYIESTILSVLNQDYINLEYIIIDGGSTDGTLDIIKKYEDRIFYWLSEPDHGIYDAMNKGVAVATGVWIHFRNCGDYFYSDNVISAIFTQIIPNDVTIIYGNCRMWDEFGYWDATPNILRQSYKKRMPFFHPASFIRSDYHKSHLYNLRYRSSADYAFFYDCLEKKRRTLYIPISITIFNLIDGFSKNNDVRLMDNYHIVYPEGNLLQFVMVKLLIAYFRIRKVLMYCLPSSYIRKRKIKSRENAGWIIPVSKRSLLK
ncbi:glycosyltransferase family 2 protein [Bacteroides hominis]|uniref:glycosyltransferase family 2 protein n=1 Tax=Bacteroides hominis TaxID=2763023 RepID=UPI003D6C3CE9